MCLMSLYYNAALVLYIVIGWPYSKGHVTVEMISQHIPPAADDVLTMVCGPDNMIASTSALLQTAGHLKKSIVECY